MVTSRHPSDILPNQEGPLFRLKEGIRERLSKSGQGSITLGAPTPGSPGPTRLTPQSPFVRGAEFARYHQELEHVVEGDKDIQDYVDDVEALRKIESVELEVAEPTTDEDQESKDEPKDLESQFSATAKEDDEEDSVNKEEDNEPKEPVEHESESKDLKNDTEDDSDKSGESASFDEIGDQFAALTSDKDQTHKDYEKPEEDEPESPVQEDVGVDEIPSKEEIEGMLKGELEEVAESIGVLDDVPTNDNGHVTKKNIKKHLISLKEDGEY